MNPMNSVKMNTATGKSLDTLDAKIDRIISNPSKLKALMDQYPELKSRIRIEIQNLLRNSAKEAAVTEAAIKNIKKLMATE